MTVHALGAAVASALAVFVSAFRLRIVVPAGRSVGAVWSERLRRPGIRWPRATGDPRPDEVADWCDLVARTLRSGSSLSAAIAAGAAADSAMAQIAASVMRQAGRGESLVAALDTAGVDPSSAPGLAVAVLRSCARFGGPAAAPLERVAATLRAREAVLAEQRAHSAQARLSARVLTLVPIALLALLATTDGKVRAAVITPAGAAAVVLGATLNGVGSLWMRRIIGRPR
jgi:Flp pilus assembly protein TadB